MRDLVDLAPALVFLLVILLDVYLGVRSIGGYVRSKGRKGVKDQRSAAERMEDLVVVDYRRSGRKEGKENEMDGRGIQDQLTLVLTSCYRPLKQADRREYRRKV